ncbi:hypothetical protein DTO027B5_7183 [Paecilomyces variotii]|nr:hypothetical protein DTO032I3_4380 [Paecilomyces variotii]KAJ9220135.1 hypothetical protein DTO169C6_7554 [Paecilomyces variotii]KAJ9230463.1 hypothetical protein DTO169E5_8426 [Paecilomyces variotii]KAJ9249061.1 hypothetical protein DTO207G8_6988 [Paecilomyces variotii]KAJ9278438.1 hypothetical protein DTO021D3_4636 [Paecilomyces variotii]
MSSIAGSRVQIQISSTQRGEREREREAGGIQRTPQDSPSTEKKRPDQSCYFCITSCASISPIVFPI